MIVAKSTKLNEQHGFVTEEDINTVDLFDNALRISLEQSFADDTWEGFNGLYCIGHVLSTTEEYLLCNIDMVIRQCVFKDRSVSLLMSTLSPCYEVFQW